MTEKKLKSFHQRIDGLNTVSYAGTVIGVTLGFSFLMNTILFANITFVIDYIVQETSWSACVLLCLLLLASIGVLFTPVKKELRQIRCVRRLCCRKQAPPAKSYRIKKRTDDEDN